MAISDGINKLIVKFKLSIAQSLAINDKIIEYTDKTERQASAAN